MSAQSFDDQLLWKRLEEVAEWNCTASDEQIRAALREEGLNPDEVPERVRRIATEAEAGIERSARLVLRMAVIKDYH